MSHLFVLDTPLLVKVFLNMPYFSNATYIKASPKVHLHIHKKLIQRKEKHKTSPKRDLP